jgi:hypothetical protein
MKGSLDTQANLKRCMTADANPRKQEAVRIAEYDTSRILSYIVSSNFESILAHLSYAVWHPAEPNWPVRNCSIRRSATRQQPRHVQVGDQFAGPDGPEQQRTLAC